MRYLQNYSNMRIGRNLENYTKVKYLARELKSQTQIIRDSQGRIVTNTEGIAEV